MRRFMCGILCGGLLLCSGCVGGAPAESTAPPVSSPGTVTVGTTTTAATTTATTTTTVTVPTPAPGVSGPLSSEQVARLNSKLSSYGGKVSVGFLDLTSGVSYRFQPEHRYFAASLMKAPFCQYILQTASRGDCDLDKQLEYTKQFYSTGTGKIKNEPYGTRYSIRTLVEYAIRYSDNAALRMLRNEFGTAGFTAYAGELGIPDTKAIQLLTNSSITVDDALIYMQAIHRFIQEDAVNGPLLHQYMTSTTNPMIVSNRKYPVVRKYGWATASFHDMAIIEAPHPYILVILTDHEDGTAADFAMFRQISAWFEEMASPT